MLNENGFLGGDLLRRVAIKREVHTGIGPKCCFVLGDAAQGLVALAKRGFTAQVVYIDPPFLTGKDFGAYDDRLPRKELLGLLGRVLTQAHGMLAADGCLYLHIDHRINAHCRLLLDEIFGEENFRNEIIWAYQSGGRSTRQYSRKHDTIFLYSRSANMLFLPENVAIPRVKVRNNHMRRGVDEQGRGYSSIRSAGKEYRYYDDEGVPPDDVWCDIPHLQQKDPERTGYPTQKPSALLRRVILASSREGHGVVDPFSGSGTTMAVAQSLGRAAAGVDQSPLALLSLRKRMENANLEVLIQQDALAPEGFLVDEQGNVSGADAWCLGSRQEDVFYARQMERGIPCLMVHKGDHLGYFDWG